MWRAIRARSKYSRRCNNMRFRHSNKMKKSGLFSRSVEFNKFNSLLCVTMLGATTLIVDSNMEEDENTTDNTDEEIPDEVEELILYLENIANNSRFINSFVSSIAASNVYQWLISDVVTDSQMPDFSTKKKEVEKKEMTWWRYKKEKFYKHPAYATQFELKNGHPYAYMFYDIRDYVRHSIEYWKKEGEFIKMLESGEIHSVSVEEIKEFMSLSKPKPKLNEEKKQEIYDRYAEEYEDFLEKYQDVYEFVTLDNVENIFKSYHDLLKEKSGSDFDVYTFADTKDTLKKLWHELKNVNSEETRNIYENEMGKFSAIGGHVSDIVAWVKEIYRGVTTKEEFTLEEWADLDNRITRTLVDHGSDIDEIIRLIIEENYSKHDAIDQVIDERKNTRLSSMIDTIYRTSIEKLDPEMLSYVENLTKEGMDSYHPWYPNNPEMLRLYWKAKDKEDTIGHQPKKISLPERVGWPYSKPITVIFDLDCIMGPNGEMRRGGLGLLRNIGKFAELILYSDLDFKIGQAFSYVQEEYISFAPHHLSGEQDSYITEFHGPSAVEVKDIERLGRDPAKTIIIDSNPNTTVANPGNVIIIKKFYGDDRDIDVCRVSTFVQGLAYKIALERISDVRSIIGNYQKVDEDFLDMWTKKKRSFTELF
eukprot:TRINITY_DN8315_c0_g1_i1.p1 TRINITY_DN8315_c0_g1~~TRINITY_DN8315_c0_g1_i1.p1  ORF type:complete len:648 (-),score=143.87 TRINITY_DN8315_c0_g1_i1:145-2088(-)